MKRLFSPMFGWSILAGNRRLFLVCIFLFAISASLSLWAFFPADVLQRRLVHEISQQTGLEMQGGNGFMFFPLGLGLDLTVYTDVAELNDLELKSVQVSPVWSSLFSKKQKINVVGSMAQGEIDADFGEGGQLEIQVANVSLVELQRADLPYRISGQLVGALEGVNISQEMNGMGEFFLNLNNSRILGLEKIGLPADFLMGDLHLEGKLDKRRFSFEKVILSGGALELSGGGNVLLGDNPQQTRLNLNVRLHPTAVTPESLRDLLGLTGLRPTADGSYLLRVGGTLAKPVIR